ncbi:MAG: hypothetical protein FJZ95_05570 [Chloroflexi bacterium]|nr:hypothetical protein [Chloroflexota bacterium]
MKLCAVQIATVPDEYLEMVLGMIRPSFEKALRPDTKVMVRCPRHGWGGENPMDMDNPYFVLLNERELIETFLEAEKEGFDAVWVNCFGDPGVRQARHVVRMPVIGPAEATLHFACQIGRRIAVIGANMPGQIDQMTETVRYHGLESRIIPNGIRVDKRPFAEFWAKAMQDPGAAVEGVIEVARECVMNGADVIVIGCCGTGPVCSTAGLNKITVDGREIPILDPTMVAAKTAEMQADIRKGTGLPIPSRARNCALPSPEDWKRVRSTFGLPA